MTIPAIPCLVGWHQAKSHPTSPAAPRLVTPHTSLNDPRQVLPHHACLTAARPTTSHLISSRSTDTAPAFAYLVVSSRRDKRK
jgi:hypothetical protein